MRASRKPSSVRNFRSWVTIYLGLSLPAGSCDYQERDGPPLNAPIPILHRVGFTWRTSRQAAGELLPRLSILTAQVRRYISVALSLESPPPDVIRHPALWSSDFPHTVGPHAVTCLTRKVYFKPNLFGIQYPSAVFALHYAGAGGDLLYYGGGQGHAAAAALAVFHGSHGSGMVRMDCVIPFEQRRIYKRP